MEIYKHTVVFYSTSKDAGEELTKTIIQKDEFAWDSQDGSSCENYVISASHTTKKMKIVEDK